MSCSCLIDTSRWGCRQGTIFLEMMAIYCFFIRNYGKYFFRSSDRESYFSRNMEQKTASICSESGNFLLLFAAGILTASIAAHMGDLGMGLHPGGGGFCLAVWQQVNDLVRVQIHQDRAERSAAQKREIINAQAMNLLCWLRWESHDSANNRHPGGCNPQARGQPCS